MIRETSQIIVNLLSFIDEELRLTVDRFASDRLQLMLNDAVDDLVEDLDAVPATLEHVYSRAPLTDAVAVVHGYNVKVRIVHGQLVISDGIGRHQRERSWPKADRTLRRIVITAPDGYVTLEAFQWVAEHAITVAMLNPDAELITQHVTTTRVTDAKLARCQVTAALDGTDVVIARELLQRKVRGQADNMLKYFSDHNSAAQLYRYAERMNESTAITQHERNTASLTELEGWAGRDYFARWAGNVTPRWDARSQSRIPSNWLTYTGRSSGIPGGGKKYNADSPVNALLNYAYTCGYTEARTACVSYGLNPALGYIHADKAGRDSLALDVLEAVRPEIDAWVIELVNRRVFTHRDFCEPYGLPPGTVRMVAPLTHEIAEASYAWQKLAHDAVQVVVSILTGHAGKRATSMPNWQLQKTAFVSQHVTPDDVLTEIIYRELFGGIVPPFVRQKQGHPPIPDRTIIAAIVHCERHHRPWAHVPGSFGISYRTMTDRRRMWQRSGHWPAIADAIADAIGSL